MTSLHTEVLVVGSGAGGATTAARLAAAGRDGHDRRRRTVDRSRTRSSRSRSRRWCSSTATAGRAPRSARRPSRTPKVDASVAAPRSTPGCGTACLSYLAEEWREDYGIDEFTDDVLDRYAEQVEDAQGVSRLPSAPPPSSATLERGATKLGWRAVEFPRVFRYDQQGRGVKQTMARTMIPQAVAGGATVLPDCRVLKLRRHGDRVLGARVRAHSSRRITSNALTIEADHVFVCAGAIQTPALLQRSGFRGPIGRGLKLHPTDQDRGALRRARSTTPACRCTASPSSRRASRSAVR